MTNCSVYFQFKSRTLILTGFVLLLVTMKANGTFYILPIGVPEIGLGLLMVSALLFVLRRSGSSTNSSGGDSMERGVLMPVSKIFVFTTLVGMGSMGHAAYIAPVGIPTPTFCVDDVAPNAPTTWPANEVSGYYYIDNSHPNNTDVDNTYGYPEKPRASIPRTYAAGDYAEIHGGPYEGSNIIITVNGTSTDPVWIRGSSSTSKPLIRRNIRIEGSYANVENLLFDTSRKTIAVSAAAAGTKYICLRNNEISGSNIADANTAAVSVAGNNSGRITSNVVIYNNLIHDLGNRDRTISENDYHGILPGQYSESVWVLNNHIYNMGGDAIQVGQARYSPEQRPNYIYIGNNLFHDDRENALDIKRSNHVIVSQNEMYGYAQSTSSAGEVVVIHNGADNVWLLSNTIYDGNRGIVTTGSTNTYFIGNTIANIHYPPGTSWNPDSGYSSGAAIHLRGSGTTGGIINNTIYNYDTGIQLTQGGVSGYDVQNNILSERSQPTGWDIKVGESDVAAGTTFDYNLIYQSTGKARIGWNSTTENNVEMFKQTIGKCANCPTENDPKFANVAMGNFRVVGDSPVINAGVAHPIFATFYARYGIDIQQDIDGTARPQGVGWDIGAYEYSTNLLPAPSNLTAIAASSSQINLTWTDNANNEDGFVIEYSTDEGGVFSELTSLAANVTTYSQTGLMIESSYVYRLFSYNSTGNSAYSNSATATTKNTGGGSTGDGTTDSGSTSGGGSFGPFTGLMLLLLAIRSQRRRFELV